MWPVVPATAGSPGRTRPASASTPRPTAAPPRPLHSALLLPPAPAVGSGLPGRPRRSAGPTRRRPRLPLPPAGQARRHSPAGKKRQAGRQAHRTTRSLMIGGRAGGAGCLLLVHGPASQSPASRVLQRRRPGCCHGEKEEPTCAAAVCSPSSAWAEQSSDIRDRRSCLLTTPPVQAAGRQTIKTGSLSPCWWAGIVLLASPVGLVARVLLQLALQPVEQRAQ